ncbi:MAG: transposase [Burkholderiales bacterium]|nr:transposase [Burkholderiales bacterium]
MDGSVRIAAADRAGRERLLRYCARPAFALERLRELDPQAQPAPAYQFDQRIAW